VVSNPVCISGASIGNKLISRSLVHFWGWR